MDPNLIDDILAARNKGRHLFTYFKDRYALLLLADYVGAGHSISSIKQTAYARLLSKPAVRDVLAAAGGGSLTANALLSHWPEAPTFYRITLGRWNRLQTSRGGANLVVQLNFSNVHHTARRRLSVQTVSYNNCFHPVAREGEHTVAWARVDADPASGTALIEEIQNDWLRNATAHRRWLAEVQKAPSGIQVGARYGRWTFPVEERAVDQVVQYHDDVLAIHRKLWDEAMLAATIQLLRHELGCTRVFYHTWVHGSRLKRIHGKRWQPPRSLYARLPRRFCFRETDEVPPFLLRHRRVRKLHRTEPLSFFLLDT